MQEVAMCTRTPLGRVEDLGEPHLDSDLGSEVHRVTLTSPKQGISVTVNSLGCRVESVRLKSGGEMLAGSFPAVLGRVHLASKYRVALRKGGEVDYDGQEGEAGSMGFDKRNWKLTNTFSSQKGARAVFELDSPDMDQGHPGAVRIEAHISALEDSGSGLCRLEIRYRARLALHSPSDAYCNLVPQLPFQFLGDDGESTLWLPSSGSDSNYAMPSKLQPLGDDEGGQVFALDASNETKIAAEVVGPKGKLAVRTTFPSLLIATTKSSITIMPHYAPNQLDAPQSAAHLQGNPGQGNGLFRRLVIKNRPTDSAFAAPDEYAFEYDELVGFEFAPSLFA